MTMNKLLTSIALILALTTSSYAGVEYDRFDKRYYASENFRGVSLLTVISPDATDLNIKWPVGLSHTLEYSDIFSDPSTSATDTDGTHFDIKYDYSDGLKCVMPGDICKQHVLIYLNIGYLKDRMGGFEIRINGSRGKILKIPPSLISRFFSSVDEALAKAKAGDTQ